MTSDTGDVLKELLAKAENRLRNQGDVPERTHEINTLIADEISAALTDWDPTHTFGQTIAQLQEEGGALKGALEGFMRGHPCTNKLGDVCPTHKAALSSLELVKKSGGFKPHDYKLVPAEALQAARVALHRISLAKPDQLDHSIDVTTIERAARVAGEAYELLGTGAERGEE